MRNLGSDEESWTELADEEFNRMVDKISESKDPERSLQELQSVFVKSKKDGTTLLHEVCGWAHSRRLVRYLLRAGIRPDVKDAAGQTPLMEASQEGQTEAVEELLEHGALNPAGGYDEAIRAAAGVGNEEMVKWLLKKKRVRALRVGSEAL